jgi:DNA-binding CsgD family transcriptional regulator
MSEIRHDRNQPSLAEAATLKIIPAEQRRSHPGGSSVTVEESPHDGGQDAHPPAARQAGLGSLGLSPSEERVYRQLITANGGSVRITARVLRLPPTDVEQAMHRLHALGLVRRSNADTLAYVPGHGVEPSGWLEAHYVPEPPASALGAMLQTQAAGLINAGTAAEQLADLYARRRPDPTGDRQLARVAEGSAVNEAVFELLSASRVEILNLDRQPFVPASHPRALVAAMLDLLQRNVSVRTIYAGDAFRVAGYNEYMTQAAVLGEQQRLLNHLPMRFLVSDGTTGILPLTSEGPWVTSALIVNGHEVVEDLTHAFEELWAKATPLKSSQPTIGEFNEHELVLLRMLSTDMTETAIGRHLGASPRTIGRRLAQIQHKLGAQTRFAMGVEAARRGLL